MVKSRMRRAGRRTAVALMAAVGAAAVTGPGSAAAGYELVRSWEADNPTAIAVHGASVYVTTSSAHGDLVTRYSTAGARETAWSEQVSSPTGIAVDAAGNVLVSNLLDRAEGLRIFDRDGAYLGGGPIPGPTGVALSPFDIDVDAKGDRYVAHSGTFGDLPAGVLRLSADGQILASWGGDGSGEGQFRTRADVASDGRGNVYVADAGNDRIQKFTDTGAYVAQWGQLGTGPGQFLDPQAVAVDARGDVYVADNAAGRIQKFDSSGRLLDTIDVSPHAPVSSRPVDVAVDAQRHVYVADDGNPEAVYVFRPARGAAAASVAAQRLRLRSGRIPVTVACGAPTACRGTVRIVKSATTIGARAYRIAAGASARITVTPTRRGRSALSRARTQRVTVQLRPRGGPPVARALVLRR